MLATGVAFHQTGALSIKVVLGNGIIGIEREDKGGDKRAIDARAIQQRQLVDESARLHALVAFVDLLQAWPDERPYQRQCVQNTRPVIDVASANAPPMAGALVVLKPNSVMTTGLPKVNSGLSISR